MRQVTVEKTIQETKWEAFDGTRFITKDECQKYENSAYGMLMSKYPQHKRILEYDLFQVGSEDYYFDIVYLKNPKDIDTLIQLHQLCNSHHKEDVLKEKRSILEKAFDTEDAVLCFSGSDYEQAFGIFMTLADYIEHLKSKVCNS